MSFVPLPPQLAAPEPDANEWVEGLVADAVALADDAGMNASEAGAKLADWLTDQTGDEPEPPNRWRVTDNGSAEWAMRHVAQAEAELAHLRQQADEWRAPIDAWLERQSRPLLALRAFMGAHLERYALERREANPKAKTLTLPSGRVLTSYVPPKVVVTDQDQLVEWAVANRVDQAVRVKREPALSDLRNLVTVVDWPVGIRVVDAHGCISIWPDGAVAYAQLEPGDDWPCQDGGGESTVATVEVAAWRKAVVLTSELAEAVATGSLPRPIPGLALGDEKLKVSVKAGRS